MAGSEIATFCQDLVRVLGRLPGIDVYDVRTLLAEDANVNVTRTNSQETDLIGMLEDIRRADAGMLTTVIRTAITLSGTDNALTADLRSLDERLTIVLQNLPQHGPWRDPIRLPNPLLSEFGALFNTTKRGGRVGLIGNFVTAALCSLTVLAGLFAYQSGADCIYAEFYHETPDASRVDQVTFGYLAELSHALFHSVGVLCFVRLAIPWIRALGRFVINEYNRGAAFIDDNGRRGDADALHWITALNRRLFRRWLIPLAVVINFGTIAYSEFHSTNEIVFGWVQRPRLEERLAHPRPAANAAEALTYPTLQDFACSRARAGNPHLDSCLPLVESRAACLPDRCEPSNPLRSRVAPAHLVRIFPRFDDRLLAFRVFLALALFNQVLFHLMTSWLIMKFAFVAVLAGYAANRSCLYGQSTRDRPVGGVRARLSTLTLTRPKTVGEIGELEERTQPIFTYGFGMMGVGCWGLLFNLLSNANKGSLDLTAFPGAMLSQAVLWLLCLGLLILIVLAMIGGFSKLRRAAIEHLPNVEGVELKSVWQVFPWKRPLFRFFLISFVILCIAGRTIKCYPHSALSQYILRSQQVVARQICGPPPSLWIGGSAGETDMSRAGNR